MGDFNDLDAYNGDTEHNMWVDLDSYENTGTPDAFNKPDIDSIIDNLNDWD